MMGPIYAILKIHDRKEKSLVSTLRKPRGHVEYIHASDICICIYVCVWPKYKQFQVIPYFMVRHYKIAKKLRMWSHL
jgi:hypothetical protein